MSRGFGVVQRALLKAVHGPWIDHRPELWLCVSTLDLGLGEHRESRRRAAHALARAEELELCTTLGFHTARTVLVARLPMGDASRTYVNDLRREYQEHRRAMLDAPFDSAEREHHLRWLDWYDRPYLENSDLFLVNAPRR